MAHQLLEALKIKPDTIKEVALLAFLQQNLERHPWNGGSAAAWAEVWWAWQAYLSGERYAASPREWEKANPRPPNVLDWRAVAVEESCAALESTLAGLRDTSLHPADLRFKRESAVAVLRPWLPRRWDMELLRWQGAVPPALDVSHDIRRLVYLPELRHLREHFTCCVVFRAQEKETNGRRVLGSIKLLSASEREMWHRQPAPRYRLELDFVYWMAMGTLENERGLREHAARLLHHELSHVVIFEDQKGRVRYKVVGHEWEDFGATVERYGPLSVTHALGVDRASAHPRTRMLLEAGDQRGRTFLSLAQPGPTPRLTSGFWTSDLLDLKDEMQAAKKRWEESEVDLGAAPWAEIEALIQSLCTVETPTADHMVQVQIARSLLERWAPRSFE